MSTPIIPLYPQTTLEQSLSYMDIQDEEWRRKNELHPSQVNLGIHPNAWQRARLTESRRILALAGAERVCHHCLNSGCEECRE